MRKYNILVIIISLVFLSTLGCAALKPFYTESPRPDAKQVAAVQSMNETNVPVIVHAQTDKQAKIASVARAAIHNIKNTTGTKQVEGITNIAANAIESIQHADGTAKILGNMQGKSIQQILQMPTAEYLAYAAMQGPQAETNRQKAYEGIKAGMEWTAGTITEVAGIATGGTGLLTMLGLALKKSLERRKLLEVTGKVINEFAADQPEKGEELKTALAVAHSQLPTNAKKEFGLT